MSDAQITQVMVNDLTAMQAEIDALKAERDRLLQQNADLQLAATGVTMGSQGECITIAVPMSPLTPGQHVTRRIDMRLEKPEWAEAVAQVTKALDSQNACLKSGSRCINTPDTIRWLCEQLAAKLVESQESRVKSL